MQLGGGFRCRKHFARFNRAFVKIIAPRHFCFERVHARCDEHAQTHRGGQQTFTRGGAVGWSGVIRAFRVIAAVNFIGGSFVRLLFRGCGARHEEAAHIPARRRVRQQFVSERMSIVRPDHVKLQCLDDFGAD